MTDQARPNRPASNRAFADDVPTTIVYEAFAETASQLIGRLMSLHDAAKTAEERDALWEQVISVRNTKRTAAPHDRQQLIDHITTWSTTLTELGEGTCA